MNNTRQEHLLSPEDLVIPLYNDLLVLGAYLAATQSVQLPSQITSVPFYQQLLDDFGRWQQQVWSEYYNSLLNAQVVAESQVINTLFIDNGILPVPSALLQSECRKVIFEADQPVSIVQRSCVQFADLIAEGAGFVDRLDEVVAAFKNIDTVKVKHAMTQVDQLNQEFQDEENQINQSMLDADTTLLTTIAKVSVDLGLDAVGDESADPLKPLREGVIQIGKDVGKAIVVDTQVGDTLTALETAISALDEAEYQLVQVLIARQQLASVSSQTDSTLRSLSRIEIEWGRVADVIAAPPDDWKKTGARQIADWASLMVMLEFIEPTTQLISNNGSGWAAST